LHFQEIRPFAWPLLVPFTAEVVSAKTSVAWAAASPICAGMMQAVTVF
jgi:hypothetical protein